MNVAPTNPFHIARAYGVAPPATVRSAAPVEPVGRITRQDAPPSARKEPTNADRLVGARVPGRIDFSSSDAPCHDARTEAIPLYRHPADLNAAATNVHAGRTLDVSA